MNEELEIVYPDECPECKSKNIWMSDWKDSQLVWLRLTCRNCNHVWKEIIDLSI